jgi:DNA-binding NarL/FixJ family response regulator
MLKEHEKIRIVLADDHEVVRAGLRRLLSIDRNIEIIDEAENGKRAVELVLKHQPDIALLDIMMPVMTGIEATREIKASSCLSYVVMLTAFEDSMHLEKAIAAGADGYLSKDVSAKDLVEALRLVSKGERAFSKSIIKIMQKKYVPEEENVSQAISITKREQEVLNLVADGKTSQQIADELFLSVRTVESHRYNLMQKLEISNTAGLVRYAVMNPGVRESKKEEDN